MTLSLQEVSDRFEIQDLLTAYSYAVDMRDWDALDEVFTPDAAIDYTAMGGEQGGVAEIKAFLAVAMPIFEASQHLVATSQVHLDGDRATSRTICHNPMVVGGDDPRVMYCGLWYRDALVRTDDGWRLAERVVERCYLDDSRRGHP